MATKFAQPTGHVVVVGSCNVDLTFRVPKMPQPGETLTGRSFQIGYGGKGANQAVMAARLGAHVKMIGRVGDDTFGNGVVNNLRTQSVDTASVWTTPAAATGSAAILVDDAGRNSIVVVPGANGLLTLADVHAASETLRAASVLLCQLEVPLLSTHAALRIAHAAGVRTILNSAPATDLSDDLIRAADIIVPNELELARITAMPVDDLEQAKAAARTLLRRDRHTGRTRSALGPGRRIGPFPRSQRRSDRHVRRRRRLHRRSGSASCRKRANSRSRAESQRARRPLRNAPRHADFVPHS